MIKNIVFLTLILSFSFVGCKKDDELVVVPGNQAPPDYTISTLVKENYVNTVYISVLGRKPETIELSSGLSIINQHSEIPIMISSLTKIKYRLKKNDKK